MQNYVTPNDTIRETDSKSIRAAIALAVENGSRRVRIPRRNERTDRMTLCDTTFEGI